MRVPAAFFSIRSARMAAPASNRARARRSTAEPDSPSLALFNAIFCAQNNSHANL
jgi:hypothetical protein